MVFCLLSGRLRGAANGRRSYIGSACPISQPGRKMRPGRSMLPRRFKIEPPTQRGAHPRNCPLPGAGAIAARPGRTQPENQAAQLCGLNLQ